MNAPLKKLNELAGVVFDGRRSGYVPPKTLRISRKLRLHRNSKKSIDPVTFEVVRHALWNVNEEHGATIQRLSGSPVAMYALDLNPSILTEDAEFVYFGPYMQYMSGVTDTQVKWTLENRSDNPGIRDGDMFLANDPWVGAAHQMDVMLLCPVFWKGELFCWVTNCLHQYDIGGITPGSFCPSARDAFDEGILLPPIKIIEDNEIRKDIDDMYLRNSRKPSSVALDFRAQLAGIMTAKHRVLPAGRPAGAPRDADAEENQEPADIRERRHRPPGGRHQRHLLRLARRDHGGAERAHVLGAVLRGGRSAAPRRLQPDAGHAQLRGLPRLGVDRAGAVHGDLALPRLQRALHDDPSRPGAAPRRDV